MGFFKRFFGKEKEEVIPEPVQTREQFAWRQGYDAREAGRPIDSCIYRAGSQLRTSWERGWYFCDSLDTGKE